MFFVTSKKVCIFVSPFRIKIRTDSNTIDNMNHLFEVLRNNTTNNKEIDTWLINEAEFIQTNCGEHLKWVKNVLDEFDSHDVTHCEAVLEIIDQLLEDSAKELSSYEMFFIIASAYFHDCGMALSDYEMKVLKLTEGTDDKFIVMDSIKNDGKKCYSTKKAKAFIKEHKPKIYGSFEDEIKNWLFVPESEDKLVDYFSKMLVEYQSYRNGKMDKINECSSDEFEKINKQIRIDYIRETHHTRVGQYIENLGKTRLAKFPISGMGMKLAKDLARVCRAHGESSRVLYELEQNVSYQAGQYVNLQFVAMMLRIGDIVHFSYDRAHPTIRSLHQFKSAYSLNQWKMKETITKNICKGKISYSTYFSNPTYYYNFQRYVKSIEDELRLFLELSCQWEDKYRIRIDPNVDKTNIKYDPSVFRPAPTLKFTLDQNKILKLLKSVGLYKNEFACLRELYQNALDACRHQIAKDEVLNRNRKGEIEFGMGDENGQKYLYCLDNGKGMSEHIIEDYLLKIGSSYYRSSEFYKKQAETGSKFVPTSQFGIGVLSCFIIGNRIEITTKEDEGDYVSCAIDGPYEYFYYKNASDEDKEQIIGSGTLVKVFLKEEMKDRINDVFIEDIGLYHYAFNVTHRLPLSGYYVNITGESLKGWLALENNVDYKNNLYKILDDIIQVIPRNIEVYVLLKGKKTPVFNKPFIYKKDTMPIVGYEAIDKLVKYVLKESIKIQELMNMIDFEVLEVEDNGVQYRTILELPKPGFEQYGLKTMDAVLKCNKHRICIDGISVNGNDDSNYLGTIMKSLSINGVVNFFGTNRPQISVDRESIVNTTRALYKDIAERIRNSTANLIVSKAIEHIEKYEIKVDSSLYEMIWEWVFDKLIKYSNSFFVENISNPFYNKIYWSKLDSILGRKTSIGAFINEKELTLHDYDFRKYDNITQCIIWHKLLKASKVMVSGNEVRVVCEKNLSSDLSLEEGLEKFMFIVKTVDYGTTFMDYDIITNLYPLVPDYLYSRLEIEEKDYSYKMLSDGFEGIRGLFNQSPFAIDESKGLFEQFVQKVDENESRLNRFDMKCIFWNLFDFPIEEDKENQRIALTAFVSPQEMTAIEKIELEEFKTKDPSYYKGVIEGWSVIYTGEEEEKYAVFIKAGKCTRKELVSLIPLSFWEEFKDYEYVFPNGELLKDYLD